MYQQAMKSRSKAILMVSLLLILSLFLVSCSSKSYTNEAASTAAPPGSVMGGTSYDKAKVVTQADMDQNGLSPSYSGSVNPSASPTAPEELQKNRKLIMEGNVYIETLEFDASIQDMDQLIEDYGGFAETRTVRGKSNNSRALRSANYVIRVPADSFENALNNMSTIGNVLESGSKGTDITDQYYDSETRVKTLKVQEQTLLDILAKATKLEDVITLESRLSEIRYQIENLENTLKNYDRLVAYSRITISIQEVDDATKTLPVEKDLGERISVAFSESIRNFRIGFENFLVWFAEAWITLIFLGLITTGVILVTRRRRNKRLSAVKNPGPVAPPENKEQGGKQE